MKEQRSHRFLTAPTRMARLTLALLALLTLSTAALAQTDRYVPGDSGNTPAYADIATAIAASTPGDTIWLDSNVGSYAESPSVDRNLTIRNFAGTPATINGSVTIAAAAVSLIEVTISATTSDAVSFAADATLTATSCTIGSSAGNGIWSDGTFVANGIITGCDISNSSNRGLRINGKTGSWTVTNTDFHNNGSTAVQLASDSTAVTTAVFDGCSFDGNGTHVFELSGNDSIELQAIDCTLANTGYRTVSSTSSGQTTVTLTNLAIGQQINANHPHTLFDGGPATLVLDNTELRDSRFYAVEQRAGADLTVVLRNGSAITSNDSRGIQAAGSNFFQLDMDGSSISANGSDSEVNIDGVPTAVVNMTNSSILGGTRPILTTSPNLTMLMDGSILNSGSGVPGIQMNSDAAVLDLTMSNGSAIENCGAQGIYLRGSVTLSMNGSYIENNSAAGVEAINDSGNLILNMSNSSRIDGNGSYGVVSLAGNLNLVGEDSQISGNNNTGIYDGGAGTCSVDLTNCLLQNNSGRGVDLRAPVAGLTISGGTLSGNGSDSQIQLHSNVNTGTVNLSGVTVSGNGNIPLLLAADALDAALDNCTITAATATRGIQLNKAGAVSTVTLSGGTQLANTGGEGIYVRGDLNLILDNATIDNADGIAAVYSDSTAGDLDLVMRNGSVISNSDHGIYWRSTACKISMDNSTISGHAFTGINDSWSGGSSDFSLSMANGSSISGNGMAGVTTAADTPLFTGTGSPSSIEGGTSASLVLDGAPGQVATLSGLAFTGAGNGLESQSTGLTVNATNCEFSTNTAHGIFADTSFNFSGTLSDCGVTDNANRGIRLTGSNGVIDMTNTDVVGNGSNAMEIAADGTVTPEITMDGCLVSQNGSIAITTFGPGDATLTMTGSTVTDNPYRALNISNEGVATITLTNSNLTDNNIDHPLVMIDNVDAMMTLDNSRIDGAVQECVYVRSDATLDLTLDNGSVLTNPGAPRSALFTDPDTANLTVAINGGSSISNAPGRALDIRALVADISMNSGSIVNCGSGSDCALVFQANVTNGSLTMVDSNISNSPVRGILTYAVDLVINMDNSQIDGSANNAIQGNADGANLDITMANGSSIDGNDGCAIYYRGDLVLDMTDSSLDGNTNAGRPTIWQAGGTGSTDISLTRSSISGNARSALQSIADATLSTSISLDDSHIDDNGEKGLMVRSGTQTLNFTSSTISRNADIALESDSNGAIAIDASITSCTVADNGNLGLLFSDGAAGDSGDIVIRESVLANNVNANLLTDRQGGNLAFDESQSVGTQHGIWFTAGSITAELTSSTFTASSYGTLLRSGAATVTACIFDGNYFRAIDSQANFSVDGSTFVNNNDAAATSPFSDGIGDRMISWGIQSGFSGAPVASITNCDIDSPVRVISTDNNTGSPLDMQVDVDGCTFDNADGTLFYPPQTPLTTFSLTVANSDARAIGAASKFLFAREDNSRGDLVTTITHSTFNNFLTAINLNSTNTVTTIIDQCSFYASINNVNHVLVDNAAAEKTNVTVIDSVFQAADPANGVHNRSSAATLFEDYNAFTQIANTGDNITAGGNSLQAAGNSIGFASANFDDFDYLYLQGSSVAIGLNSGNGPETYAGARPAASVLPQPAAARADWLLY